MGETPEMSDRASQKNIEREKDIFEIRVQGHLHPRWSGQFSGLAITPENDGTTTLCGQLPDQTALHGILLQIRNMNLRLISVNQVKRSPLDSQSIHSIHQTNHVEAMISICRKFHEAVNTTDDQSIWNEKASPAYIEHRFPFGEFDLDSAKDFARLMLSAFTERQTKVDEVFVEGDMAALRWTTVGTHTGELFGVHPTGIKVDTRGCSVFRFKDRKIAEAYIYEDWLGLLQQLGAVPHFRDGVT